MNVSMQDTGHLSTLQVQAGTPWWIVVFGTPIQTRGAKSPPMRSISRFATKCRLEKAITWTDRVERLAHERHHVGVLARALKIGFRTKVRHVDDQGVPLPVTGELRKRHDARGQYSS
jgi:hypothetical protein